MNNKAESYTQLKIIKPYIALNDETYISSFIADTIGFAAALLTIITALVVIYNVTMHSKLKTLVANIALQCIRTVEATALNPDHIICETGLEKMLSIINLAVVTIMAIAKQEKAESLKENCFLTPSRSNYL